MHEWPIPWNTLDWGRVSTCLPLRMPKTYLNPPLLEAICDIEFGPGAAWDVRTAGVLSERLTDYPELQHAQEFSVRFGPEGVTSDTAESASRVRLWSTGRDRLVQVGPRTLSVNRLRPYGSWADYRAQIEQAISVYSEVTSARSVESILLTYVNQMTVAADPGKRDVDITELFSFRPEYTSLGAPAIGAAISVALADPGHGVDLPAQYELQLRTIPSPSDTVEFQLVVAARSALPMRMLPQECLIWLDRTHAQIETYFEAAILPPLRALFDSVSPT